VLTAATNALGFPKTVLKISIIVLVIRWVASLIAAQFDVETVAFANACVYIASLPVFLIVANDLYRDRWSWLFGAVPGPLAAAIVMAIVTYAVGRLLTGVPAIEMLVVQVLTGVASYVLCLKLFAPELFARAVLLATRRAAATPDAT
jgi:hypothetical protein